MAPIDGHQRELSFDIRFKGVLTNRLSWRGFWEILLSSMLCQNRFFNKISSHKSDASLMVNAYLKWLQSMGIAEGFHLVCKL